MLARPAENGFPGLKRVGTYRASLDEHCPSLTGTESSNLAPSSGESIANPTFAIRTNPVSGFAVDCRLALALEGSRGRVQPWRRCRGPPSDGVAGTGKGGRESRLSGRRFARRRGWIPQATLPA